MASALMSSGLMLGKNPEELAAILTEAIQTGDVERAKVSVGLLSSLHIKLNIDLLPDQNFHPDDERDFSVTVQIESRRTHGGWWDLMVSPNDSIRNLKRKAWLKFGFTVEMQRWIIGKKIPDDGMTLKNCGVTGPGYTIFLYIADTIQPATEDAEAESVTPTPTAMSNTMLYDGVGLGDSLMYQAGGDMAQVQGQIQATAPPASLPSSCGFDSGDPEETKVVKPKLKQEVEPGWVCSNCTYRNLPTRPGCEMCTESRPEGYQVPEDYQLTDQEMLMVVQQEELERLTRQDHEEMLLNNFLEWMALDDLDLIRNTVPFTCPICMDDFGQGEGVVLRECLHHFCQDCLQGAVTYSQEAMLKCPFQDDTTVCESNLQEREIRALVPEETFIKFLQRSLDQAESQAANSFHCKTADCKGWCVYEDEVNFFNCPICQKENCLTCKVIHQGQDCKQYQAELAAQALNDQAARKTQHCIQEMVKKGEAMHCPTCQIVLQKKEGCDWLKCSVCKTEICWVTKGPRWGPKGPGDVTGGCKCGLSGRCHPKCGGCH